MAATEVSICNMALTRVGSDTLLSSMTEGSKAARLCTVHYEPCRDAALEAHLWNFAISRATLSQDVTAPNHEFAYRYLLPSDFLRLVQTYTDALGYYEQHRIEGQYLVTDDGEVQIEYVAKVTDPARFPALFVDLLAQRLAAEICMGLTNNTGATEKLWQIYETKLREARFTDAVQGTPRDIVADTWTNSRI
jgi:hypothetical protein